MMHILPGRPTGKPDQMSPIRAAVPNLGHAARPDDDEFADAKLVNNVYEHVERWLDAAGEGAQVIFVDNSPPVAVDEHVVVRFSGRATQPPFGLIDDATT